MLMVTKLPLQALTRYVPAVLAWMNGVTKDISENWAMPKGKEAARLVNVIGPLEAEKEGTEHDARMSKTSRRGHQDNMTSATQSSNLQYHDELQSDTIAIVLLGNSGSGKSTLLNLLGGQFGSGVKMRKGFTKNVQVQEVELGGKIVELIDVPGLFEPNDNETRKNAEQLTEALTRNHEYILYFVLRATNRGLENGELLMMAKFNLCIRRLADGEKVSYRVIVNQIMNDEAHDMYTKSLVRDNFRSLFKQMNAEGFSFDIRVESVHLLSFGIDSAQQQTFRKLVEDDIRKQRATRLDIKNDIAPTNNELRVYHTSMRTLVA
ncbi:hypothetical protein DFQ27_004006 [Actinomortierella ambigua]|uniref:G domain-containing protein n=1 Tax=Actinomortierella ambigua TaxID=1343610 RepID=A0A9P6QMK8_9FUNG|nr:hypothetical protein DFQ27_004006 [Actinomortierella ambigua]